MEGLPVCFISVILIHFIHCKLRCGYAYFVLYVCVYAHCCVYLRNWWSHGHCLLLFLPHRSLKDHMNLRGGAVGVDAGAFETSACFDQQTLLPLSVTKEGRKMKIINK